MFQVYNQYKEFKRCLTQQLSLQVQITKVYRLPERVRSTIKKKSKFWYFCDLITEALNKMVFFFFQSGGSYTGDYLSLDKFCNFAG